MSGNPPVTTRHRATFLTTQTCESLIPTSFDDESIQLCQQNIHGSYGILEHREEACISQFSNPTVVRSDDTHRRILVHCIASKRPATC